MYDIERQNKILELLQDGKPHNVYDLSQEIYVSNATIRRDLIKMENKGLVTRTFGAVVLNIKKPNDETSFQLRENINLKEKMALCAKAATFLSDNMTLFIDSSSTLLNIVPYLNKYNNLIIITNGLYVGADIITKTNHKLILVGGEVHPATNSLTGNIAFKNLSSFHADLSLMSCAGYDIRDGFFETSLDVSELKKEMVLNSDKTIVIFDNSKFGNKMLAKSFTVNQITNIITDHKFSEEELEMLGHNRNKIITI